MSAQTQKTVLTLGIFGVLIFLAWKIWPTVKRAIGQWLYGLTHLATLQAGGPLSDPLYGSAAGYDSAALDSYQISANPLLSFTDFSSTPIDSTGGGYATTSYDPSLDRG